MIAARWSRRMIRGCQVVRGGERFSRRRAGRRPGGGG